MNHSSLGRALLAGAVLVVLSAASVSAHHREGHNNPDFPVPGPKVASVPEIDATRGLAALSAVFAALALAWERRRHHG